MTKAGFPVTGFTGKTAMLGVAAIGRQTARTGHGLLLTIDGPHEVMFMWMATGTILS